MKGVKLEYKAARRWREKRGLTIPELAAMSGVSPSQIHDYERGFYRRTGKEITPDSWRKYRLICAALDANLKAAW